MDRSLNVKAFSTITLAIMMTAPSALGQFKQFKSKPRMESNENNATNNPFSASSDNNTDTFGSRGNGAPKGQEASKYVQLNPETAFGPEVITSFDFPDTDILELTKHMQKLTGLNFIIDKDVKGKVSISAPNPITVGDAWRAYLTALNMANLTLVKSGAFYRIIQVRDIKNSPTKIYTGSYTPDTEQHIMKVISVKHVSAKDIEKDIRQFTSRYGRVISIDATNKVIITDTGANIARLEKLIKFVDVPGFQESLQIINVQNTSAQELAKLLDEILKNKSGSSRGSSRRSSTSARFSSSSSSKKGPVISKLIAEPRTNSIIAMANADGAKQLKELIAKLDVRSASINADKIHVHYLNFGDAEELSKTLSNLVSGATRARSSSGGGGSRNFIPRNNDGSTLFNGEVKVTADKNNNALVVTASATDWLTLKNVIEKLDVPRDQVYVEGMIVETSLSKVRSFGTEYYGAHGAGAVSRAGFKGASSGIVDLLTTQGANLSGLFIGGGIGSEVDLDFGGETVTVNSVNGLLRAIATNTNSNVLATPQIMTMDNKEAVFEVGTTVPVQTVTVNNGVSSTSFVDKEAKLSLTITPQINKVTRIVKLNVKQSVNDFRNESDTSGAGPITDTRTANTEIMVKDGDTIAMGGLIRDKEDVSYNKVPLLGDIPVLGWLFKNKTKTVRKTNLLFFLTPKIISPNTQDARKNTLTKVKQRQRQLENSLSDNQKVPFQDTIKKIEDNTLNSYEAARADGGVPDIDFSDEDNDTINISEDN